MVLLDQWVNKGQKVTLVLQALVHQENQVKVVPQVCLDLWDQKVLRVLLVSQALLACQVLANRVNLESQETEDHLVLQEPLVRKESQAQLDLLVCQVPLVLLAHLVHKAQEDSKASQAKLDPKATLAWLAHQAKEERKVNREHRVSPENQVALDQLVLQECKVMMVLQAQRVHKVMLALQECLVQMVPQDLKDTQDPEEHQVKLVRMEDQDQWDHLDLLVLQVLLDSKVIQVIQAPLALLA
ncbi:unnamed protein product [Ophioblennius macclurei]